MLQARSAGGHGKSYLDSGSCNGVSPAGRSCEAEASPAPDLCRSNCWSDFALDSCSACWMACRSLACAFAQSAAGLWRAAPDITHIIAPQSTGAIERGLTTLGLPSRALVEWYLESCRLASNAHAMVEDNGPALRLRRRHSLGRLGAIP